jgi:aspartyl-tRNA(Asn)/glutamyl-tRNA(Gln) amidotransferase subunit A
VSDDLVGADAVGIATAVRSGRVTATEVLERALQAIEEHDAAIGAFVFLDAEGARRRAAEIDEAVAAGHDPGPQAGVPLGVKELQAVAGWPFTNASTAFRDRIAPETSTMVERAIAAGAVPVGLTASPELGRSAFTASALNGVCRNPWDLARTPGGSSGGSAAAVAAGMVPLATGTDGAGSLRIPASFSGLVGFKGTHGRVPRGPEWVGSVHNLEYGVLSTTVRDTARFLDCVVGHDERDPESLPAPRVGFEATIDSTPLEGLRVVWSEGLGYAPCDPEVASVVRGALDALLAASGAVEVEVPIELVDCSSAFRTLAVPDVWDTFRDVDPDGRAGIDASVHKYLDPANEPALRDFADAHASRHRLVRVLADLFDGVDLIVTPATQLPAFAAEGPLPAEIAGTPVSHWTGLGVTFPFNLSGHPAVSVPAGFVDGTPIGLQIVGRRHDDHRVMAAARALERARPWPRHAPTPAPTAHAAG